MIIFGRTKLNILVKNDGRTQKLGFGNHNGVHHPEIMYNCINIMHHTVLEGLKMVPDEIIS